MAESSLDGEVESVHAVMARNNLNATLGGLTPQDASRLVVEVYDQFRIRTKYEMISIKYEIPEGNYHAAAREIERRVKEEMGIDGVVFSREGIPLVLQFHSYANDNAVPMPFSIVREFGIQSGKDRYELLFFPNGVGSSRRMIENKHGKLMEAIRDIVVQEGQRGYKPPVGNP